jgi:hypothetical protein
MLGTNRAVKEGAKAAKEAAREQMKASREVEKARKAEVVAAEKAKRTQEVVAKKAADAELREARKVADYWTRAHQRATDQRLRAEQQATRIVQRESAKRLQLEKDTLAKRQRAMEENARRGRGFLGASAGGVLAGATAGFGAARSVGGIRSVQERVQAANEFRERLTIVSSQAGVSSERREQIQGQVMEASKATGKDSLELMGVLETGQAQFNDLAFFADHLKEIATIARSSGADAGEFARALGFTRQAFGLSGDEAMEAANLMVAAAAKGSIEVKDFATSFAPVAGLFVQSTGLKGMQGVRQFLGTSQAAGTLGKSADETATLLERFIAAIGSVDVQKDLKASTGINVKDMTPEQIIERLATSRKFAKAGVKEGVFKDIREQQAVTALIAARNRTAAGQTGAIDIGAIASVDAGAGAALTQQTMTQLEGSGALSFDRQNATLQEDTLKKLGDYNAQLLAVNEASSKLEQSFGTLSLWASTIAATGVGSAVGGALSGGMGGMAGGAGGGMLGKLGGAVGRFGIPGMILAGGAAASAAVYQSGIGEDVGNWVADKIFGETPKTTTQGMDAPSTTGPISTPDQVVRALPVSVQPTPATTAAASSRTAEQLVSESKKGNQLLEQLVRLSAGTRPFVEPSTRRPQ